MAEVPANAQKGEDGQNYRDCAHHEVWPPGLFLLGVPGASG
jgi:hypothetical protein